MSRLWEKGLPLDERVLRYTAGEDHLLDARLVRYDVRGSIAHAEMLAATRLISEEDFAAIRDGLSSLLKSFEDGEWRLAREKLLRAEDAGAAGLGIRNVLCLSGDHHSFGPGPVSKPCRPAIASVPHPTTAASPRPLPEWDRRAP